MAISVLLISSSMMLTVKAATKIKINPTTESTISAKHEFDFDGGAAYISKGIIQGDQRTGLSSWANV